MNYQDNLIFQANKLSRKLNIETNKILKPSMLEVSSFFILCSLYEEECIGICQRAFDLGLERSTLSRGITNLLTKRYAKATNSADKRIRTYTITDIGKEVVEKCLPQIESLNDSILQDGKMLCIFQVLKDA